jgi:tRNA modification GTPase
LVLRPPDTIAAVATPPGQGGIGVVRVSGPGARHIAAVLLGRCPEPRTATVRAFRDAVGEAIDRGVALFFAAPASYTGEDVLELHGHGGPVVLDLVLARVLSLGARAARPGEFTERAFLNGKLDLAQAEAVADLIASATAQAARSAQRSLEGALSDRVRALDEEVTRLRVLIEAALDFPEEEVEVLEAAQVESRLDALLCGLDALLAGAAQGRLLRDGAEVVITGRPNVGKSSLLNALTGQETAIVTAVPGTTRDLLHARIQLDGLPVHLVDTAGLREVNDPVEWAGVERARGALRGADAVLVVLDASEGLGPEDRSILMALPAGVPHLRVWNKVDLLGGAPAPAPAEPGGEPAVWLSALTGQGLPLLSRALKGLLGFTAAEDAFLARRRHLEALGSAREAVDAARVELVRPLSIELVAEELRRAQGALGSITGQVTSEDLLGRIFSSFCIGK